MGGRMKENENQKPFRGIEWLGKITADEENQAEALEDDGETVKKVTVEWRQLDRVMELVVRERVDTTEGSQSKREMEIVRHSDMQRHKEAESMRVAGT